MRAVFFDFDGVLTTDKTGSLTTLRYLSAHTGIDSERLRIAFRRFNTDLNLGRATYDEVWPALCEAIGSPLDRSLLAHAFESTPLNVGMMELALRLKEAYSVGMITDNKKERIDHLKRNFGLADLFDPIVVSAEVGSSKNDVAIFLKALSYQSLKPNECVFIDNSESNLRVADSLGFKTVYFDDSANDVEALKRELVELHGLQIPAVPNPSVERTFLRWLRQSKAAAHVER